MNGWITVFYCIYKGLVQAGWLLGIVFTHYSSDVRFDIGAPRHASKSLSSVLQISAPMPVSLYQKHMINEVRSFVDQPPDWFGIRFGRRQIGYAVHALWHVGPHL